LFSGIRIKKNNKKTSFSLNNLKAFRLRRHLQQVLPAKGSHGEARDHPQGGPKKNQHCECWEANTRNTIGSIGTLEFAINLPWCFIFSNQYPASMTVSNLP
jgi:hypothetical protein